MATIDRWNLCAERGVTVSYEAIRSWCRKFGEALACKDFRETVGGGARAASRAGNLHERDGRLDKTIWIHCGAYFFNQIGRE